MSKKIKLKSDVAVGYAYTGLWDDGPRGRILGWCGIDHLRSWQALSRRYPSRPSNKWLDGAIRGDRAVLVKVTLEVVRDRCGRIRTMVKR